MSRLLLVRHGSTEYNSTRRFAGASDIEMNAVGYQQIERLCERLANERIDIIYSSNLKRALTTAEVISAKHNVEIVPCTELREINYGEAEGLTFEQIGHRYPAVAELIANFNPRLKFPGGEGFEEFAIRTKKFLDKLEKHVSSQTILVVSHSGPLQALVCHLLGIDLKHWWQIRIDNASLTIIDTYPRGAIISLLNDTSHLR